MSPQNFGAFVPGPPTRVPATRQTGPLAGLTFAVKDLFDVAGERTGAGNPDWRASHPPAARHARAVQALLDAGAELVGRAVTVELAFGMDGDNVHHGMPINPAAPERIPGGSSCGSAVAVAGGLCDAALGSDTGGSVRIPASYCGVFGMRPSHGWISTEGVVPLSPSFDTVGFFARSARILERIGGALLRDTAAPAPFRRLLWAEDVASHMDSAVVAAVRPAAELAARLVGRSETVRACATALEDWAVDYRSLMAREAWESHGHWISTTRPRLGSEVAKRFESASKVSAAQAGAAAARRALAARELDALLSDGGVLCLPTAPTAAPPRGRIDLYEQVRLRAHLSTCIAGLARLPQLTVPAGLVDGAPVGLSFVGPRGTDAALLELARRWHLGAGQAG